LKDQPQVRVELQGVVGGLLHNLAIEDAAIKLRKQRVEQLEAMGASVAERAQALRDLADSQDARGDTAGAKTSLERGLALCKTTSMQPVDVCYGLQVARGQMYVVARDMQGARQLIKPAVETLRLRAPNSPQMADALVGLGDVLSREDDFDSSFRLYEEAMGLREKLWGKSSVRLAKEKYELGMSLWQVLRLTQADASLASAWQTMSAALGKDHVNSALIELQLGRLRTFVRSPKDGRALIEHASSIILKLGTQADPRWIFDAYIVKGTEALLDGRLSDAGVALSHAAVLLDGLREQLPSDGGNDLIIAWYLDDSGQHEKARQLLDAERHRLAVRYGSDHPYVARLSDAILSSYLSEGKSAQARNIWEKSFRPGREQSQSEGDVAMLISEGRFQEAAHAIEPAWKAMQQRSRTEQYLLSLYQLQDQMGRIKMGLNQPQDARAHFEAAIKLLATGNDANPYLAMSRARYGLCLVRLGDVQKARIQMELAQKAFSKQPAVSAQFKIPLADLQRLIAGAS